MSSSTPEVPKPRPWRTFVRLAGMSKRYAGWYLVIGGLCALGAATNLGSIESIRQLIDAATRRDAAAMWSALGLGITAFLLGAATGFAKDYLTARVDQQSTMNLQIRMVGKVQRLARSFIDRNHSGDIITRVLDNSGAAQSGLNSTTIGLIQNVLNVAVLLVYLIHLNWQLSVGTVLSSLALPGVLVPLSIYQKRIWDERWKMEGDISSFVQDSVQGGEVARAYGLAGTFRRRFSESYEGLMPQILKSEYWGQSGNVAAWTMLIVGLFFVLGYGGTLVSRGLTTAGTVTAFLFSFERIGFPISNIIQAWPALQKSLGAADRVFELLDAPEQTEGWGKGEVASEAAETMAVQFDDVSFEYAEGQPVLSGLTFSAEAGKVTAVVGESGSGKSTILKLVLGMYLPTGGSIRLGSTPITEYTLASWRDGLGYVSQDVCLFGGSLEDNISMGSPGATHTDLLEASVAASCDEFVTQLPDGYTSEIGEKGVMLSGGQRQRVAIARAILKRPKLLLLDEATSALDNESERLVQDALERFCKGRTTIVVAHRLSTIMGADKIVFLEGGRLAEEGTHEELMLARGRYYQMFTAAYEVKGGVAI